MSNLPPSRRARSLWVAAASLTVTSMMVVTDSAPVQAAPPVPTATVTAASNSPLVGEGVELTVTFDNTDDTAAGFAPYVDLVFDSGGADGDDGASFDSATYLGSALAPLEIFECDGDPVTHPLNGADVACPAGTQLVVLQLPFGSFTPDQPVAPIQVRTTVSPLADVGFALDVTARGGFAFGDSPTGTDPIIGPSDSTTLVPEVVRFTKRSVAPENETATGPNYQREFVLEVDIADGVSVSDLTITDRLPNSYVYLDSTSTLPGLVAEPTVGVVVDPAGNVLEYTDTGTVVGGPTPIDASTTFVYYINDVDFAGNPILNASTGNDFNTINDGEASGRVVPQDSRDDPSDFELNSVSVDAANDDDADIDAKSIAVQKSVSTRIDSGAAGNTPGDELTYTIRGQVSDYFTFDDVVVNDILGDGQTFDPTFTPTLTINENGASTAVPLDGFFTVDESARTTCGDGTTAIDVALSDAYDADPAGDGILTGGLIQNPESTATTFEIVFHATIDDSYQCTFSGTGALDPNDFVINSVSMSGEVLDNDTQASQADPQTESDESGTQLDILPIQIEKSVWARNGDTTPLSNPASFTPGDTISYRLSLLIPSSDFESLTIDDYLPLPTLIANDLSDTPAPPPECGSLDAPDVDTWCYGPLDTMHDAVGYDDPTVTSNATANNITWDFGSQETVDNEPRVIELLFTLEVADTAFRDGLFLTNQVQSTEQNSFSTSSTAPAIVQIELNGPELNIRKGVVARSANPGSTLTGTASPTGVAFDAVTDTTPCQDFTGVVSSDNLANGGPDANATGLDAGDIVRYAIVVENTGTGSNGAFDVAISDVVPDGFAIPTNGLDLCVTDGAGTALANTATGFFDGASATVPGTLTLTDDTNDPDDQNGALAAFDPTAATNVAVITYNLTLVPTTGANTAAAALTNTASITDYSASSGGLSIVPLTSEGDLTDDASVSTRPLTVAKEQTDTSEPSTDDADVAIGEEAEYTVTVTVPEGTSRNVRLVDTLPTGLVISRTPTSAVLGADLTATDVAAPAISGAGQILTFDFGDITNSGASGATNAVTAADQITFTYWAVVTNTGANQSGDVLANSAAISYDRGATGTTRTTRTDSDSVTIVEPTLQVAKSSNPTTYDAGDTFTYTIDVRLPMGSPADAFDVALTDELPSGLTYGAPVLAGGIAPTTPPTVTGNTLSAGWDVFEPGDFATITIGATVPSTFNPNAVISNTASIFYTGLPGAPVTELGGGEERNGDDGPGGALDDYAAAATAVVNPINPGITKTLAATDQATTTVSNVTIGEVVTYDITVDLPEGELDGFVVTDLVPDGLQYVAGSGEVVTGAFAGTLPAPAITGGANNGEDVVFTFGSTTVTPDGDDTNNAIVMRIDALVLDVAGNVGVTAGQTTLNNTARVQVDGGTAVTSTVVATPVVEPRLTILKTFSPPTASENDTVTVEFEVENIGLSPALDVIIVDELPVEFDESTIRNVVPAVGFTRSPSDTDRLVTFIADPGATIAAGDTVSFFFDVDLDDDVAIGTVLTNLVTITDYSTLPGDVDGERDEPDVTSTAVLNTVGPDLRLSKNDGVTEVAPGASTTYDLEIVNDGGFAASGVFILDTLPAGTTFGSVGGTGCTSAGESSPGVQRIDVAGTIAASGQAGDSVTCTITINIDTPAAAGTTSYLNSATVTDDGVNGIDPTDNNTATDTDMITGSAPVLVVSKDDGVDALVPGATTSYTIVVTNTGNIGSTNVMVTDTLPDGLTFVECLLVAPTTAADASSACAHAAQEVTISFGEIAGGGGSVSFTIEATVDQPVAAGNETLVNTASVIDDGANSDAPVEDSDSDTDAITAVPDMTVEKSHTEPDVAPGGTVNWQLVVSNDGLQNASGVIVTDTVDSQMTIDCGAALTSANPPSACDEATGVITWGPGLQDSTGSVTDGFVSGGSVTLNYQTTVDSPLAAGTVQFVNNVEIDDDGSSGDDPTPMNNVAVDAIALAANAPDLAIIKDDGETSVTPGQEYAYTLTVTNNGNIGATGVTITDTLPAALAFVSCSDSCDSSADPVLTWTLPGAVAGDGGEASVTVTVRVREPAAAGVESITNMASVTDDELNGDDPTPTDNSDDDENTLDAAPVLTIDKDDGTDTRAAGEEFDYTILVSNTGNQAATDVMVTDTLPDALTAVSCPATSTPCTIDADAGTVTWNVGALNGGADLLPAPAAGSSVSLGLTVVVDDVRSGVEQFTNTVGATDDGTNTGGVAVTATDTDTDTVVAIPDLQITKSDGVTMVQPGDTLAYDIVVTNAGTQAATGVTVVDTLPTGVTFVSCSASCDDSVGGVLTWTGLAESVAGAPADPLAFDAGGQLTLTVIVTVDDPAVSELDSITNSVVVADDGTNGTDPTPENNIADDVDVLDSAPDLRITKSNSVDSVTDGQRVTYLITYTNAGNQDALGVVVTDTLAPETTFDSCTDGCDSGAAPTVSWTVGDLAPGEGGEFTVTVVVDDPVPMGTRTIVNNVTIADDGTNGPDSDPTDNADDDSDTYGVDLAVTKTDNQISAVPGGDVTYTITVTNDGPTTITEFTLDETLPTALSDVTFSASAGGYDPATGAWSGFGGFAEGETLTLTVSGTIDADATGTLVNKVSVQSPDNVPDTDLTNNDATDTDALDPVSNLMLTKTLDDTIVDQGDDATFTITVTNTGPSTATGVVVTDPLPGQLSFVRTSADGWKCSETSGTVTCALGDALEVGASATVQLVAEVVGAKGTSFVNTASVTLPTGLGVASEPTDSAGGDIPSTPTPTPTPTPDPGGENPATPTPTPDTGGLPRTGSEVLRILLIGLGFVLAGILLVGIRRRPKAAN